MAGTYRLGSSPPIAVFSGEYWRFFWGGIRPPLGGGGAFPWRISPDIHRVIARDERTASRQAGE